MQVMFTAESRIVLYNEGAVIVVGGVECNTNLFRTSTELVQSPVNPHTHWVMVKFTSQHDRASLPTVANLKI